MEQVGVAMPLFELLQFFLAFFDYLWIVDVWHGHIMPLMSWIGIRPGSVRTAGGGAAPAESADPARRRDLGPSRRSRRDSRGVEPGGVEPLTSGSEYIP